MTKFSCPVNYNLNNCSSKEYGLTCDTCFHNKDDPNEKEIEERLTPSELKAVNQGLKEARLIRQGKMKRRTWDDLIKEMKKEEWIL